MQKLRQLGPGAGAGEGAGAGTKTEGAEGTCGAEGARLVADFELSLREALFDDLNVSAAFAALFNLVRRTNRRLDKGRLGGADAAALLAALHRADAVLGVLTPDEAPPLDAEIEAMVQQREAARRERDYATADRLRGEIEARGIALEDTPEGPRWRPADRE